MKWYRGRDGNERLWLERDDIESMMEDELRKAKLFPPQENPSVDIERFIERYLRVRMDQHADLESSVLGVTEFYTDSPPKIFINRDLTGAVDDDETPPGVLGRWRATLAHEASHVVLHRILFELQSNQGGLFHVDVTSEEQIQRLMRCLKSNVLFRNGGSDWREVQANLGMAALLMPRSLFSAIVNDESHRLGFQLEAVIPGLFESERLVARMTTLFSVSRQAALIRMETLGLFVTPSQPRLV